MHSALSPFWRETKKDGWFRRVLCGVSLRCELTRQLPASVRDRILVAAIARERWLLHPSMAPLVHPQSESRTRLPQLIAWVIGHTPAAFHILRSPGPIWLPDGTALRLPADSAHRLDHRDIKAAIDNPIGSVLPLDVTGHWAPFANEAEPPRESIVTLLTWWEILATEFPAWAAWVRDAVGVATLLPQREGKTLSGSSADMPGHFWLTVPSDRCDALETLIHESAHCHLLLEEMLEPLVADSGHSIALYSPLRKSDRPMRGAFFAAHAMVYMLAFHIDFVERTSAQGFDQRIRELRDGVAPLMRGIKALRDHLTHRGRAVFAKLQAMVEPLI